MSKTDIEWATDVWNPTTGCDLVSPGCDRCYAKTMAKRLKGMEGKRIELGLLAPENAKYQTDGNPRTSGPGFGIAMHEDALTAPMSWKSPRKVFVNSMSDLFHDGVSDEFLAKVFAVMAATPQHIYQCLTKRHGRMRSLLNSLEFQHAVARNFDGLLVDQDHDPVETWRPIPGFDGYEASSHGRVRGRTGLLATAQNPRNGRATVTLWNGGQPKTLYVHRAVLEAHVPQPSTDHEACHRNGDKLDNRLANLRWGTRSENQQEKVRHGSRGGPAKLDLLEVEAIRAARLLPKGARPTQQQLADQYGVSRPLISLIESGAAWAPPKLEWPLPNVWIGVSVEDQKRANLRIPALLDTPAAVRFLSCEPLLGPVDLTRHMPAVDYWDARETDEWGIHWVIVGGESGHGARPVHPAWVRTLRDQCAHAGVPFFFKQWGEWGPAPWRVERTEDESVEDYKVRAEATGATHAYAVWADNYGHQPYEAGYKPWSAERTSLGEEHAPIRRWGKKAAGRELDGRTHDEFPGRAA